MSFPWPGPTCKAHFGRNMDNAACAHSKVPFVSVYVYHTGLLLENGILFVPSGEIPPEHVLLLVPTGISFPALIGPGLWSGFLSGFTWSLGISWCTV